MNANTATTTILYSLSMQHLTMDEQTIVEQRIKTGRQLFATYYIAGKLSSQFAKGKISVVEILDAYEKLNLPTNEVAVLIMGASKHH